MVKLVELDADDDPDVFDAVTVNTYFVFADKPVRLIVVAG